MRATTKATSEREEKARGSSSSPSRSSPWAGAAAAAAPSEALLLVLVLRFTSSLEASSAPSSSPEMASDPRTNAEASTKPDGTGSKIRRSVVALADAGEEGGVEASEAAARSLAPVAASTETVSGSVSSSSSREEFPTPR